MAVRVFDVGMFLHELCRYRRRRYCYYWSGVMIWGLFCAGSRQPISAFQPDTSDNKQGGGGGGVVVKTMVVVIMIVIVMMMIVYL